jgi:hypothetical protein
MTSALLLTLTVDPTLAWMQAFGIRSDDRARVMLLEHFRLARTRGF